METMIRKLDGSERDALIFQEAAELIRRGELVAFPTETVYGLGGNGLDPSSSRAIYAAKGRPSDNPLILHIADREALTPLVREIPPAAEKLMDAFWPGPLTVIFNKTDLVPKETTGGLNTVAVRMPSHPGAAALIRAAGVPIAAPSANASGRPSPTCARHVYEDLSGRIPLIIDGGESEIGLESTIVDVTGPVPEILRPGYIGLPALRDLLGTVTADPAILGRPDEKTAPRAPGMKYRHYAPQVPLTLVTGPDGTRAAYILQKAQEAAEKGEKTGVLVCRETLPLYQAEAGDALLLIPLGARSRPEEIAHGLFAALRHLDECGLSHVYSETFDEGPLGTAIMNRLRKAAAFDLTDLSEPQLLDTKSEKGENNG